MCLKKYPPSTNTARTPRGFTLIEMIISVTMFAVIILMAFGVLGNISIVRLKISDKFDMNNELYFAIEQLTAIIKEGGSIDYEEYWNRRSIGTATASGHYSQFSGYGNYGSGGTPGSAIYGDHFYYCRSGSGAQMGTGGCLTGFNSLLDGSMPDRDYSGKPQRYGQYKFQFIDYNSYGSGGESTEDLGDDDSDGNIRWDDDDEDLGVGPEAFSGNTAQSELYLLRASPTASERLYLRWNLRPDPYGPTPTSCTMSGTQAGSGCLGNIQILRLVGRDYGISHSGAVTSTGRYDGAIDTWECRSDFNCLGANNLPTGADSEWVDLFPSYVNVRSVSFFLSPSKHPAYSWTDADTTNVVNPYIRLNITLWLAWERRKKLRTPTNDITVSTTINLAR